MENRLPAIMLIALFLFASNHLRAQTTPSITSIAGVTSDTIIPMVGIHLINRGLMVWVKG